MLEMSIHVNLRGFERAQISINTKCLACNIKLPFSSGLEKKLFLFLFSCPLIVIKSPKEILIENSANLFIYRLKRPREKGAWNFNAKLHKMKNSIVLHDLPPLKYCNWLA